MIKAMRWSAGRQEAPVLRDVSKEGAPAVDVTIAQIAEYRAERAALAEKTRVTVEDAMREMDSALAVQRELRASANRLLTKLVPA